MATGDSSITKEAKRQLEVEKEKERLKAKEPPKPLTAGDFIRYGISLPIVGFIMSFLVVMFWGEGAANFVLYGSLALGILCLIIGVIMALPVKPKTQDSKPEKAKKK